MKDIHRFFDIKSYLDSKGIRYDESGKNVSNGWIGLNCVFCDDHSNHLGINLEKKYYSCWNCGASGNLIYLVKVLEGCSFPKAHHIAEQFLTFDAPKVIRRSKITGPVSMPKGARLLTSTLLKKKSMSLFRDFFIKRNFPFSICERYDLHYCKAGDYPLSIIIPVYLDGRLVSYQSLDVTGERNIKYLSEKSIKKYIYNFDSIHNQDKLYFCEGVTDVWRVGDGALGFFGKNVTIEQLELLVSRVSEEKLIYIVFDSDAMSRARATYNRIVSYFNTVKVIRLTTKEGDPGDLSARQVEQLRGM